MTTFRSSTMNTHSLQSTRFNVFSSWFHPYFPYPSLRPSQVSAFFTPLYETQVFFEGDTGSGKTILSLVHALHARKHEHDKIIIFTPTLPQATPFLRELALIKAHKQPKLRYSLFLGKNKLCRLLREGQITKFSREYCESCPYKQKIDALREKPVITLLSKAFKEPFTSFAEYYTMLTRIGGCPYYTQFLLHPYSNIIITMHAYLTPPLFSLLFKKARASHESSILIIDEAHHLLDSLYFPISFTDLTRLTKLIRDEVLWRVVRKLKRLSHGRFFLYRPDPLKANATIARLYEYGQEHPEEYELVSSLINLFSWKESFLVHDTLRNTIYQLIPTKTLILDALSQARNVYYLSANPFTYSLLSQFTNMSIQHVLLTPPSPPMQSYIAVLMQNNLSSRENARTFITFQKLALSLQSFQRISPKAVLALFPSYDFMERVFQFFPKHNANMIYPVKSIDEFLQAITWVSTSPPHKLIGVVQGSGLDESIEFTDQGSSLMSMAVSVGIPYPEPDLLSQIKLLALDHQLGTPATMTYYFKEFTHSKILQFWGRIKRFSSDKTALIILDYRGDSLQLSSSMKRFTRLSHLLDDLAKYFS